MAFVVIVKGERLNASYSLSTSTEAVAKAETFAGSGVVTIVDPYNSEYPPNRFPELLDWWRRREHQSE